MGISVIVARMYIHLSSLTSRGAFSVVLTAKHNTKKTRVAIKVINTTSLSDNERERLKREIEVNRLIAHPNTVEVYEIYQTAEDCCLVME